MSEYSNCTCTALRRFSRQDDSRPGIVFRGVDGDECEDFILAIRQWAFGQGKSRDYLWLANFASTCFAGPALRWHISLDKVTRSDWTRLEQALIEAYPPVPRTVEQMPLPELRTRFAASSTSLSVAEEPASIPHRSIEIA